MGAGMTAMIRRAYVPGESETAKWVLKMKVIDLGISSYVAYVRWTYFNLVFNLLQSHIQLVVMILVVYCKRSFFFFYHGCMFTSLHVLASMWHLQCFSW